MDARLERKAVNVAEARKITGLGRNTFYSLLQNGKIKAFRIGARKWVIPIKSIDEFLSNNAQ